MTMMKKLFVFGLWMFAVCAGVGARWAGAQQVALAGLRSAGTQGQFNGVATDGAGNIFLVLDERDGVRVLKTDAAGANVLAQARVGSAGDAGLGIAVDAAGNVYVTGTTTGSLAGAGAVSFPNRADATTNSFVAKFDNALNELWLTFGGSGRMAAAGIAVTPDAVFVTGSIFAGTLPVTSGGVIQSPAPGSTANGFVERFSAASGTLLYATYLSGANGNTSGVAIAADAADDAYVVGNTSATGYPTVSALVPSILLAGGSTNSGFVTKLSPAGDGILFSTFVPGDGLSSVKLDAAGASLLVTGSVALGQFPVATVTAPVVNAGYQALLRLRLDGSAVTSSTLLTPGTQSFVAGGSGGSVWVDGGMTGALLPYPALESFGNSFALHVTAAGGLDAGFLFGGLAVGNPSFASAPVNVAAMGVDASGNGLVAGSLTPTASAGLLGTQRFDLGLVAAPNSALPSTVRGAVPVVGSCNGSLCSGSAAFLAKAVASSNAPVFSFSIDDLPNITLRNFGAGAATGVTVSATGYTVATNCGQTLAAGGECSVALTGAGPGSITATAANAATYTVALGGNSLAPSAIVFSAKELDLGVQSATSAAGLRVITVSNLSGQSASFNSGLVGTVAGGASFFESASDCATGNVATTKVLGAGASCHITIGMNASANAANDGFVQAEWAIGGGDVLLTGYQQAAAVNVSASEVDFGTQFVNGLRLPRYLYLSNNSDHAVSHAAATLPVGSSFTVTDLCGAVLDPHTVCQMRIDYLSATAPSTDSELLVLDAGVSVLLTGETLPQPTAGASSANPNLSVTPTSVVFANAVVVMGVSSNTQTVTVKNTGATGFTLALALTGDFTDSTNCGATLAGGASCSVVISFTPSAPGVRDGLLAVTAGGGGPVYVSLSGTGTAIVAANNGTIDFGEVPLGVPVVRWLKVAQSFPKLTVSVGTASYGVVLVEDTGYGHGAPSRLAFAGTATGTCFNCWIGVQFLPTVAGVQSDALAVTSIAGGKAYVLALTGTGVAETGVFWTPVSEDFGAVAMNSSSNAMLFMLTNETGGAVTVGAPTASGDFAVASGTGGGAACAGTLANTASCFVRVIFAPTATGVRVGGLSSVTSAGTVTAALMGVGVPDAGLGVNPDAVVFENVPGTASTQQTVTISNTRGVTVQVGTITATNAAFAVASNCGALAAGATCSVTVTFTPQVGPVSGAMVVPVTFVVGGVVQSATYVVPLTGAYTREDAGIAVVPGQVNYGASAVDAVGPVRTFVIDNLTAKSLTVTLNMPRQFSLVGGGCGGLAPFASCSVAVAFVPLTSGDVTGTLFVQANPSDNSGTLNGIGYVEGYGVSAKTLAVTGGLLGGVLDFGQVVSGQSSSKTLTVTNNSKVAGTTVTVRRVTSEWPFLSTTDCIGALAVGASCHVSVNYSPLNQQVLGGPVAGANADAGVVVIESDAVTSPELVDVTGSAAPVYVAAPSNAAPLVAYTTSTSSLSFAATQVGNVSAAQTVTLSNTGTTTIHIFAAQAPADYLVTNGCVAPLVPGASCDLQVALSPKTTAVLPRALEISSDASTSLEFVSLIGLGTPAVLVLSPTSLDFGTVLLGATSRLPVQVTNTSSTPVTMFSISANGDYSTAGSCPAPGGVLAANTSCTVQVTFAPTQVGVRPGTLSIGSSASAVPITAPLTGIGVQAHLVISPTALNFGNIALGSSANLPVILSNVGTADVTGIATAITGDYQVTTPCAVTTLVPGASCTMMVTFTPAALGARVGTLTITSSDPASPTVVPLTGVGIASASFTLTVDGAATSTQTVISGRPAYYTLMLTPVNGFNGTVVLNCTPLTTPVAAFCSLLPSSVTLSGTSQNALATINTVSSVAQARLEGAKTFGGRMLCLLALPLMVFGARRRMRLRLLLWMVGFAGLAAGITGCGSGGDPYLRYTAPGTYQFQVTANSASGGVQITQSVVLNLVVTPR